MAFKAILLGVSTVAGQVLTGPHGFTNLQGNSTDPLPVILKNVDPALTIYVGGQGVSTGTGYPLLPNESIALSIIGTGDQPYVISASGTPNLAVLAGRQ